MNNDSIALSERARAACADMRRAFHHLALLLVELVDEGRLRHLGYASLTEYAATVLDLSPREARGLYRLGTAFPTMPALAAAMEAGALDWTKARELLRVITPDTEAEWVARAQVRTSRELEREVSATPFGAPPPAAGAPIVPESQRGRLILEGGVQGGARWHRVWEGGRGGGVGGGNRRRRVWAGGRGGVQRE